MLVVVGIIGLLSTIATLYVQRSITTSRVRTTQAQIDVLKTAIDAFHLEVGRLPVNLEELVIEGDEDWPGPFLDADEVPSDAWGNAFNFSRTKKRVRVASAGLDGQWHTEDDIWK